MKTFQMLLGGILAFNAFGALAIDADDVLKQVRERNDGNDYISSVTLNNYSDDALVNFRKFYLLQKDKEKDEQMVIAIKQPVDVRDVSFLMQSYDETKGAEDEQWMYLPAFRKVRRISAKDKRGAFMGGEFSYFDLDKLRVTDFDSKIIGEEDVDGSAAYIIERIPKNQAVINKSGYYKVVAWIDKARDLLLKQDYYDAKGILFKTYHATDIQKVQDIWTVTHSVMTNFVEDKRSEFIFHETKYNQDLRAKIFRKSTLKRGVKNSDVASVRQFSEL